MPSKLAFPLVALAIMLAHSAHAAGSEPCMADNRWCGARAEIMNRVRMSNYSGMPTDPDPRIRAQMQRDRIQDKGQ